jgi:hypothetical protein
MRALLLLCGFLLPATHAAGQEPAPPDKARIRQLVSQLADDRFAVREAAQRELLQFVEYALDELAEAAASKDLEQARRAKHILGTVDAENPTHRLLDALGQPIKKARIEIKQGGASQFGFTDRLGRFTVPNPDKKNATDIVVDLRHPDYGSARWRSGARLSSGAELIDCKTPLVHQAAEARKRAVHGQVIDGHGKPVVGAVLHCSNVRTQGEGLINAEAQSADVLTDTLGRFALYIPIGKSPRDIKLHGDLVPPGSRYNLFVTASGRDDCFPVDDMFSNDAPVEIRLPLATQVHRIQFAQLGGDDATRAVQMNSIAIEYYPKENDPRRVRLDVAELIKGRKLIPGKYMATHYQNGKVVHYLPLRVEAQSPEVLTFELPSATVYHGRAVDGITGKPMSRVWATATTAVGRGNLAELTEQDWNDLRAMPAVAGPKDAATRILGRHYGIGALVRTDDDGRFEITEPPGVQFYDIMVFAENVIPIKERINDLKRTGAKVALDDLPLFPAAKLSLEIPSDEKHLPISPSWKLAPSDQPNWIERFRSAEVRSRRAFVHVHWIPINEAHPIFIPAGVRVRVEFDSPYDERWGSASTGPLDAKQGEVVAGGVIRLPKTLPVSVRVVDHQGNPLEGLAVRSLKAGGNIWSIAHNTDAQGLAHFHFPANSAAKLRIDVSQQPKKTDPIERPFEVRATSPALPIEFRLTAEQLRLIQDARTTKK